MKALCLACVLLAISGVAVGAGLPVVEPVMAGDKPVTEEHNGKSYPVFRAATDKKLVEAIDQVFTTSFAGEMKKLFALSREVASARNRRGGATDDPEFDAPLYLLLSEEEGGYARRDFFLQDLAGKRTFTAADYIDMQIDLASVRSGDFKEVFCHEVGHTILHNLVGDLLGPRSNKMHQSMALTDYRTAFDEGFAEHFQPIAREYSTNPELLRRQHGGTAQALSEDFFNARDSELLRNFGPKMDMFVHERLVPPCTETRECYVLEETSTAFDLMQLRTGQQMLASEGVNATVFYHFISQTAPTGCITKPGAAMDCTALESSYRLLFQALAGVKPDRLQSPLIAFLNSYRDSFPKQGYRMTFDFLMLTRGATASQELFRVAQEMNRASARADIPVFREKMHALQDMMNRAKSEVIDGKLPLDAAVGPELWVRNESFAHSSLWSSSEEAPLRINLNTASAEELATLEGLDPATAQTIVKERRQRGYFESVDQLVNALKLSATQAEELKAAERSQETAKPDPVQ